MVSLSPSAQIVPDSDSIMSSIEAVKEVLSMGMSKEQQTWEDELIALKQLKYYESRRLENQILEREDVIRRLNSDLKEAICEVQREKALRITLESANDAMQNHKKELSGQVELITKSKEDLEDEINALRSNHQEEKRAFQKEKETLQSQCEQAYQQYQDALKDSGVWEAKFLTSERENQELKMKLLQIEATNKDAEMSLSSNIKTNETSRKENKALQANLNALQTTQQIEKDALLKEQGVLREKYEAVDKECKEALNKIAEWESKFVASQSENEELKRSISKLEAKHERDSSEAISKLKQTFESQIQDLHSKEQQKEETLLKEKETLHEKYSKTRQQYQEASKQMTEWQTKLSVSDREIRELKVELSNVEAKNARESAETISKLKGAFENQILELQKKEQEQKEVLLREKETLQEKLSKSDQQYQAASEKVTECQAKLSASEKEIGELKAKISNIETQNQHALDEATAKLKETFEFQIQELQSKQQQEKDALMKEKQSLQEKEQQQKETILKEKETLQEKYSKVDQQYREASEKVAEFQTKLSSSEKEIGELKAKISNIETQNQHALDAAIVKQKKTFERRIQELQSKLQEEKDPLVKENKSLQEKYNEINRQYQEASEKMTVWQTELSASEKEIMELKSKLSSIEAQNARNSSEEISKLKEAFDIQLVNAVQSKEKEQKEKFMKEKETMEEMYNNLNQQYEEASKNMTEWQTKLSASEEEIRVLKATLSNVKAENERESAEVSSKLKKTFEKQIQDLQTKEKQQKDVLLAEKETLQDRYSKAEKQYQEASEKLSAFATEIEQLKDKISSLEAREQPMDSATPDKEVQSNPARGQAMDSAIPDKEVQSNPTTEAKAQASGAKDLYEGLDSLEAALAKINEQEEHYKKSLLALGEKLKESHKAHTETLNKMDELIARLAATELEISEEDSEREKEAERALDEKNKSLSASFKKISKRCDDIRKELSEESSPEAFKEKKEQLMFETKKMGAIMESMESVHVEKVKLAKEKANKVSVKLSSIRELWRVANESVTDAQAESDKCLSSIEELKKEMAEMDEKLQPPPPAKKTRGRPRKRQKKS